MKKKMGKKTVALGTFLGNSKNLIKILKNPKKIQKVGKQKNNIFYQKNNKCPLK
jgi:hypothetical protein